MTKRSKQGRSLVNLGTLEGAVLGVVYSMTDGDPRRWVTGREVCDRTRGGYAYTTTNTVLMTLTRKGYLKMEQEGAERSARLLYRPTLSRRALLGQMAREINRALGSDKLSLGLVPQVVAAPRQEPETPVDSSGVGRIPASF